jgi:hypothetical protein
MASSTTIQPSHEELRGAFQAGFYSIDDGDGFYFGFRAFLEDHGFALRDDLPCTCSDNGAHGHQPECRWVKD